MFCLSRAETVFTLPYQVVVGTTDISSTWNDPTEMDGLTLTVEKDGVYDIRLGAACYLYRAASGWISGKIYLYKNFDTGPVLGGSRIGHSAGKYFFGVVDIRRIVELVEDDVISGCWEPYTDCTFYNKATEDWNYRELSLLRIG